VVAIAITLLILPLVDAASALGTRGVGPFLDTNRDRLFAFTLSFAVIGLFWWGHHRMFEKVKGYNSVLAWGLFIWLFSIVFLPFPTELLGSAKSNNVEAHAIYIGTMLVTAIGALVQQWAIVKWPELQDEAHRGEMHTDGALVLTALMGASLVVVIAVPAVGLWSLLGLVLSRPIEHLLAARRAQRAQTDR
jgi:uncharacterized membrane protein